jgi:predicted adenylyl cyclase CyaB
MNKNLEFKAKCQSLKSAVKTCNRLGARKKGILRQTDTYFKVKSGRLKVREINGEDFELIWYMRENVKGSRYSDFIVVPLEEPKKMKALCRGLFGVRLVVVKHRLLYMYKNARIHIDTVRGLGKFVEFEVIVNRGKNQARQLMDFLIAEFRISKKTIVAESYSDLLLKLKTHSARSAHP